MNDLDWTRLVGRITPAPDGEKPVRHRAGTVLAVNPDTTVTLDLGGQEVEEVRVLGTADVNDVVQVLAWEGDLLALGSFAGDVDVEPFPLGAVMAWPTPTAPNGWLLCNGQAVSRTDYAALFGAIGTTYGAGDGSTTFNVPDMRGRVPLGVGTLGTDTYALAAVGGSARVALALANLPPHNHSVGTLNIGNNDSAHQHPMGHTHDIGGSFINDVPATGTGGRLRPTGSISTTTSSIANTGNQSGPHAHGISGSTGDGSAAGLAGTAHENRPPFLALNFIILYNPEFKGFGSGGGAGTFLPLAGGTMTGDIVLAGDPDAPLEPVTLQYLQTHYLPLTGGTLTGPLTLSGDPTLPLHAATKQYVDASGGGGGGGVNPTGVILPYGGTTPPAGYLMCDGALVSRTTYAALFSVLGTAYGAGDGSTTFGLPDMRGRFPLGVAPSGTGSTRGGTGGSLNHTHTGPSHSHSVPAHVHDLGNSTSSGAGYSTSAVGAHDHTVSAKTTSSDSHSHSFSDTASDSFTTSGPSGTGTVGGPGGFLVPSSGHSHSGSVSITVSGTTSSDSHSHTITAFDTSAVGNHSHEIPAHVHDLGNSPAGGATTSGAGGTGVTGTANPPFQAVNYIVKT